MPAAWREGGQRAGLERRLKRARAWGTAPHRSPMAEWRPAWGQPAWARLDAGRGFGYQGRGTSIEARVELWLWTLPAVTPPWTTLSICGPTPVSSRLR